MSHSVPEDQIMIVALLAIALCSATCLTGLATLLGMPLWGGLILFPMTGSITLLLAATVIYGMKALSDAPQDGVPQDHALV